MANVRELLNEARKYVPEITPDELERMQNDAILIDVRELDEYEQGSIPGAIHVPRGFLEFNIDNEVKDKSAKIVLYCAGGVRSLLAGKSLKELGYENVVSLEGGFNGWKDKGKKWSLPRRLTPEQRVRYHRHLLLPEVGVEGQLKLLDSKVLLLGAGGLGSPAALYLAAAGVGTLGIIDMDVVDASNLQRQVLHNMGRVGEPKVESAKRTINELNPDVNVITYNTRLSSENILDIFDGYDVIVDGTDNFPTRYLVNDASLIKKIPVVHGSIFRFEGQVSVFYPYKGPCYRCLIPEPPPKELAPSCAEAGVLGVLCGIIGSIEAMEAIKILLNLGKPLIGRLLSYDSLTQEFRTFKVNRDPNCATCSENAGEIVIAQYDELCMPHNLQTI